MTTLAAIRQAIADVGKEVSGITKTFTQSPLKVDSAELPALIALAGPALYDGGPYGGLYWEQRQFRAQVVVGALGQRNSKLVEETAEALLEDVRDAFRARPSLGDAGVDCAVLGDGGVVILGGFEGEFIGFEVILQVRRPLYVTHAEGE
jgi:hypothetical protein